MATRCRHLESATAHRLASHVGQVGHLGHRRGPRRGWHLGPIGLASQNADEFRQSAGAVDAWSTDQRRLPDVTQRHHQSERRCGVRQRDHPGDMAQRAIQSELTAEGEAGSSSGAELVRRQQQPHGDGQVESGAALADAGGRRN